MFQCPHCHEQFEIAPKAKVAWWKYDSSQSANLGCGTLILIAVIVAIFSNTRGGNEERTLRSLQENVQAVEKKVDTLGDQIRTLSASVKPASGPVPLR